MLDHDSSAASKRKHTITCYHHFFCDGRRTDDIKFFSGFSGIDAIIGDKGFVLFVKTDWHMKCSSLLHCLIAEYRVEKRNTIIGEATGACIGKCIEISHFFTIQTVGDRSSLVDMYIFFLCALQNIFQSINRVYGRLCICHTDDRGKSTLCSCKRTGMDIFFVSESRITKMHVCID